MSNVTELKQLMSGKRKTHKPLEYWNHMNIFLVVIIAISVLLHLMVAFFVLYILKNESLNEENMKQFGNENKKKLIKMNKLLTVLVFFLFALNLVIALVITFTR